MAKTKANIISVIPEEKIINKIYLVRGVKVILDKDLAEMFGVQTKRLKEAVRRNMVRFPEDFMFEMTEDEYNNLRSQIATSSWGGPRYKPFAFTEQGVSMLSGVLNSPAAVQAHIHIVRVFIKMREMLLTHKDILLKLEGIEKKITKHDEEIAVIFKALKQMLQQPKPEPRKRIGFKPDD